MTGTGLLVNYGKFLTCLTLALVPGLAFGLLVLLSFYPVWRGPPALWALVLAIGGTALLSGTIFGLALRAKAGDGWAGHLRVAFLMQLGLLPLLSDAAAVPLLLTVGMPGMLVLYLALYPLALAFGTRDAGWPRVWTCTGIAAAVTLTATIGRAGTGSDDLADAAITLLVALITLGFLPFAGMARPA